MASLKLTEEDEARIRAVEKQIAEDPRWSAAYRATEPRRRGMFLAYIVLQEGIEAREAECES